MQTDDLPAPLVQLSQALVSGIVIAHTKTMICFANQFKISSCRINKDLRGASEKPARSRLTRGPLPRFPLDERAHFC
jgi:hypothetical protein